MWRTAGQKVNKSRLGFLVIEISIKRLMVSFATSRIPGRAISRNRLNTLIYLRQRRNRLCNWPCQLCAIEHPHTHKAWSEGGISTSLFLFFCPKKKANKEEFPYGTQSPRICCQGFWLNWHVNKKKNCLFYKKGLLVILFTCWIQLTMSCWVARGSLLMSSMTLSLLGPWTAQPRTSNRSVCIPAKPVSLSGSRPSVTGSGKRTNTNWPNTS